MSKEIKVKDLFDEKKREQHAPELLKYFQGGGTWQDLLGYDQASMDTQYTAAYNFYQEAEFHKAAACFSYLTNINPYVYSYWMGLGLAQQSQKQYAEAIVAYTMAGAIENLNPIPSLHAAQCYWAMEEADLAREELERAVEAAGSEPRYSEIRKQAETLLKSLPR